MPHSNIHTLSDLLNSRTVCELQSIASNQYHRSSLHLLWKQNIVVHAHDELVVNSNQISKLFLWINWWHKVWTSRLVGFLSRSVVSRGCFLVLVPIVSHPLALSRNKPTTYLYCILYRIGKSLKTNTTPFRIKAITTTTISHIFKPLAYHDMELVIFRVMWRKVH